MVINKKLLSAVLSAAMILSTITAPVGKLSSANAETLGNNSTISYKVSPAEKIADKIQKTLKDDFKTSTSKVTFLVKLKDQVDTVKVAKKATAKAETQGLTAYKTSLLKRSSIVSELKIKSDVTQRSIRTYLDSQKKKGNVSSYEAFYIVNGLAVTGTETVMNELAAMPEVESIEENGKVELNDNIKETSTTKVSTTKASTTKVSTTSDTNIEPNILQIGADKAWGLGIDGSGITIASLDSGVQWDHPALITKYRGYNPSDPGTPNNECNFFDALSFASNSGNPFDDMGHGTHTMGTMVGSCTDGTNKIGVAPGAKWIAARIFSINGDTQDYYILRAGQWLLAPVDYSGNTHPELAPNVINNSWGRDIGGADDWFRQIVINWKAAGIFPEFSAGNTNYYNDGGVGSVATPGSYPEAFTTGAVDADNNLADFSLRGPSPYGVIKPDISAPGVNIRSSVPGSKYDETYSGTSMAGPCVTATAALIMQANPSLTVDQIEQVIRNTATQRTDSTYPTSPNNGYGYGVVNAYMAVSSVLRGGQGVGKVKGQVLKEGKDSVPPTFSETIVEHKFAGFALPLNITAHDDVSIKTVELQYIHNTGDQWITLATTQLNGGYKGGDYTVTIPASEIAGTSLQYRWRIVDFGNNEVFSDIHTVTIINSITDGYFTDFETEPDGWKSGGSCYYGNNTWWWGTPSQGIGRAASGTKVYATNLRGEYPDYDDIYAEMPRIDLPQGQSYLQFKQWYNVEDPSWLSIGDFCYVEISKDDTNWNNLATYTGSSGADYTNVQLDLSAYAGQRIYIRFHFKANEWASRDGWFIDDVGLSDQPIASVARTKYQMNKVMIDNNGTSSISTSTAASGLPLYGRVTALENGTSAITSIADGSYSLVETAGDYTLQAESYGYYPQTRSVYVAKDNVMDSVNFTLNPIPKGLLTGKVTNAQTGEPIADAVLYLIEDAAIAPVFTDSEGNYSINAYEGSYTLYVSAANYCDQRISVSIKGNGTIAQNLQLKPYVGYSGQISYDDGTAENATASNTAGNGFGVRMTLADGKSTAMLTAGMFMFYNEKFPDPGATDFKIAVYDAAGKDGKPGNRIAGPFSATAIRDENQWTTVDLSAYGIAVPHDFYLVYIQTDPYPYCPGICTDLTGNFAYRSYSLSSGLWAKLSASKGNIMIRSAVNYEVQAPVITAPKDNSYTNNSTVTVKGTAKANTDIHILNNDKEIAVPTSDNAGNFSADVSLAEGNNVLKAYSLGITGRTDYSKESTIILDTAAPVLNITSPADNLKTDKEAVTVQGTINETNLDNIQVNGIKAEVNSDGTWSARITLNEGINTVETVALDKAGNKTTKTIKIDAKFSIQNITNLLPDKDAYINAGSSVKIEFDSEINLKNAVFTVSAPLLNYSINGEKHGAEGSNALEYPMTEVVDEKGNGTGHYVGYWKADSNVMADGAQIEVKVTDWYGNTLTQYASGKLYADAGEKISVNRISGIDRYETSEKIAEAYGNGQKVANIILTSGTNFPDALSGSILTASLKAPMLLVGSGENNTKAYNYIKNYLADGGKVYILGGTGAVSQAVEDYVTKTLNKSVIRIAGADRFETNKNIINKFNPAKGTPVIIATSETFADALSVSSVAAIKGYPILLAEGKDLSASALSVIKNIQPASIYVIGGTAVVNENIITEIKAADSVLTASDITRIAGIDRYETSLKVLEQFKLNKGNLIVATGTNFADALSGAALAAKENASILLTDSSVLKNQISAMSKFTNITVVGGYGAVTQDVEYYLNMKPALPAYIETSLNETVSVGSRVVLPQTVTGYYADGKKLSMTVVWDKNASLDTSKAGTLIVTGAVEGYDTPVTLTITVKLLAVCETNFGKGN